MMQKLIVAGRFWLLVHFRQANYNRKLISTHNIYIAPYLLLGVKKQTVKQCVILKLSFK